MMNLSNNKLKEIIHESILQYLTESEGDDDRQTIIETAIAKGLIQFLAEKEIKLAQISVNWNPTDQINSYLIRFFIDANEKYIGILLDAGLNISHNVNLQENYFIIGDERDQTLFKLMALLISDSNFVSEMLLKIQDSIQTSHQEDDGTFVSDTEEDEEDFDSPMEDEDEQDLVDFED